MTTTFNADSTAAEVVAGIDLTGRRAVVTGASSGIGVETARALASAGAEVTLAVRDAGAGERIAADITTTTGNKNVLVAPLDLADQRSVAAFSRAWDGPLHILVHNAGLMTMSLRRSPEGWELDFAINHLGHFALATGLYPALRAAGGARVVAVSSIAHVRDGLDFDDLHFERRPYDPMVAYAQSKTANVLFAVEAAGRWAADGITVNALHPGAVPSNLAREMSQEQIDEAVATRGYVFKTPELGAATSVFVAARPEPATVSGRYFEDCAEAPRHTPEIAGGIADHALDPDTAARLWRVSLDLIAR